MKAILLAQSEGAGLWPVPAGGTAAGAPLLGLPLLVWSAQALKEAGVSELILALSQGAEVPEQDVLPVVVRRVPEGTDGISALLACADLLDGADFLAAEAGFLWSGGLRRVWEIHRAEGCAVTRVVFRPVPAGHAPAGGGHVLPFPAREEFFGLGVAVCSPEVFSMLDGAGSWEELFSRLRQAEALDTVEVQGFSANLDSPAALLRASADLLGGKRLPEGKGQLVRPGIWAASPLPEEVELVPPCSIGAGVELGRGCLIGPHAVLEDGVTVGEHSLIQRSVLQTGVRVGSRATVYGGIVCRGARLGNYAVLNEGAAVGPEAQVGDNAALMENVGVGAGLCVPPSTRLTRSLTGAPAAPVWTVEDMLRLGRRLGKCGAVGAGGAGFRGLLLARAFCCGAAAQGASVALHDGVRAEQAAWLARYYRWPASFFADEDGEIYLFDAGGDALREAPDGENGKSGGNGETAGSWDLLAGTAEAYAAAQEREQMPSPARAAFHSTRSLEFL